MHTTELKPENILLHDGNPLVADFGIALAVPLRRRRRILL
jgi:serine/threonine protein kinase